MTPTGIASTTMSQFGRDDISFILIDLVLYVFARISGFMVSAINSILTLSIHDSNGKCTPEEIPPAPMTPTFIFGIYLIYQNLRNHIIS